MTEVVDWQRADPRQTLSRAVGQLKAGGLVAFPTEAGPALTASGLCPDAVARLHAAGSGGEGEPLTVAVGGAAEAPDWVPGLSRLGRRLARRCWPGPLTLVSGAAVEDGLASRLPESVRARALTGHEIRLRTPAHEAILQVMRFVRGPVLLAGVGENGNPMGEAPDLWIEDGPSRFGQPPTVVRVEGENWSMLREGALPRAVLERLLPCRIVFVCTGNTCRSPLAEALCKKLLAERLGCAVNELPGRGFCVLSAGIAAMMGGEAAPEAVDTARELGADLVGHRSQPLTRELLAQADHVIAMTRGHLQALGGRRGLVGPRPQLLARDGADIPDPIGASPEVYRECARQILAHLEALVPELQ
jgi:protein-tyrosine phosphatase